jgi:hypothetical protein
MGPIFRSEKVRTPAPPLRGRHSRPLETSLGTPLAMGKDKKKDVGAAQVRDAIGSRARRGFCH